jgi:hypothetical protein
MKTKLRTTLILFTILINCGVIRGQDQVFSKNSIKIGLGIGASMGGETDGSGLFYIIGYQREIWKDRLRLNPNFSIGQFTSKHVMDARDQYFNSINFETNLYYDLIKGKSFSMLLGCGGLINNSRGIIGTGGDYDQPQTSENFSDYYFGGYLGWGFRINSQNKRTAINIIPVNLHFGNNYFTEFYAKLEMDFKF